jgi:hypothetical protein
MADQRTYGVTGHVYHTLDVVTHEGLNGAAKAFKDLYGAWPEVVTLGEKEHVIEGGCESCLQPIFEDQKTHSDREGVEWHCAPHCCECATGGGAGMSATADRFARDVNGQTVLERPREIHRLEKELAIAGRPNAISRYIGYVQALTRIAAVLKSKGSITSDDIRAVAEMETA